MNVIFFDKLNNDKKKRNKKMTNIDNMLKKVLGKGKAKRQSFGNNINKILGKTLKGKPTFSEFKFGRNLKNASVKNQMKWKKFDIFKKTQLRLRMKDFDKDGVPDRYDCRPYNRFKHITKIGKILDEQAPNIKLKSEYITGYFKGMQKKHKDEEIKPVRPFGVFEPEEEIEEYPEEEVEHSEQDIDDILDEYEQIINDMTPQERVDRMQGELKFLQSMSPREQANIMKQQQSMIDQMNDRQKRRLQQLMQRIATESKQQKQEELAEFEKLKKIRRTVKQTMKKRVHEQIDKNYIPLFLLKDVF